MTVVAVIEAFVLLAVVHLLMRSHASSEQAWTEERRELVSRIQAPHHVPVSGGESFVMPELEPDEFDLVGTVADPP